MRKKSILFSKNNEIKTIFNSFFVLCKKNSNSTESFSVSGAEDVDRFAGNLSNIDYFRLVIRDGNYILVGARYVILNFP